MQASPSPQWARSLAPAQPRQLSTRRGASPGPLKTGTWPQAAAVELRRREQASPHAPSGRQSAELPGTPASRLSATTSEKRAAALHYQFPPAPFAAADSARGKAAQALSANFLPLGAEATSDGDLFSSAEQLCESMSDSFEEKLFEKKVIDGCAEMRRSTEDSTPSSGFKSQLEATGDLPSSDRRRAEEAGREMTNLELFMKRISM